MGKKQRPLGNTQAHWCINKHTKIYWWHAPEQAFQYSCFVLIQDHLFLVTVTLSLSCPKPSPQFIQKALHTGFRVPKQTKKVAGETEWQICLHLLLVLLSSFLPLTEGGCAAISLWQKTGVPDEQSTANTWAAWTVASLVEARDLRWQVNHWILKGRFYRDD